MTMKKLLLGSVAFVALTAGGPAGAADLRTPVLKAPPAAAPVPFNWSKCYFGGHVGYGWGKNTNSFGAAVASGPTARRATGAAFRISASRRSTLLVRGMEKRERAIPGPLKNPILG